MTTPVSYIWNSQTEFAFGSTTKCVSPKKMSNKGWGYTQTGRLSKTIQPVTSGIPQVGDDEVVIEIKAMALNPVDEQM